MIKHYTINPDEIFLIKNKISLSKIDFENLITATDEIYQPVCNLSTEEK